MSPLLQLYLDQFLIFVLVLTRIGSLLMSLPMLGTATIPWQIRGLLAVGMSLVLTPVHFGLTIAQPENVLGLATLLIREAILGLALGLAVMILLSGMQLAGQIISQTSGMTLAEVANPNFESSVPVFSQILEMLALGIFFVVGGHRQVIDALLQSFDWMPPGQGRLPDDLVAALSDVTAHSFEVGLRASAPVMVSLLLATLVVALISRTLPQLNAVAVGLNFNSLIVLAVFAFCLGSAAWIFQEELGDVVATMVQSFAHAEQNTASL